ncbi:MAG: methyltransferase protein [Actinomycetia bacterium]|jgi:demethylmenaquinone methyltransferase/2-methoxy-6-polyprenyl-1,4-benzoquinol methylase|nr:methyltransferase protein [Actinomycetes bacterium]
MAVERTRFAKRLFAGIASQYERMGVLLSFGQDARWRRFLVSRSNAVPGARVLDVAAGTQLVSRALAAGQNVHVVALDQSEPMLRAGGEPNRLAGLEEQIRPVLGHAERLPFGDGSFDAVSFTYLLRYVDDPPATVHELVRVLRVGGSIAMLEFSVPEAPLARLGWWIQTRVVMRLVGIAVSPAWARTTAFLGPSISRFVDDHPIEEWVRWFQAAGIRHVRTRSFLFGSAVVLWGVKS